MPSYLIKNITIADGSGAPCFQADVGIAGDKIALVGDGAGMSAETVIQAEPDMVLCPGFFDTHTHNDFMPLRDRHMTPQLMQGVTFDLCGNCGISVAPVSPDARLREKLRRYMNPVSPVGELEGMWSQMVTFRQYREAVEACKPAIHCGQLVGHGTLRIAAMGMEDRKPTAKELEHMKSMLEEALQAGAMGLSSGLIYAPGVFSDTEEMVELCNVVARYNGVYATHMRNESYDVVKSVEESIDVARRSGVRLIISHHKIAGLQNRELYKQTLAFMDAARAEGLKVICDEYLYNMGATTLSALFPPQYMSKGVDGLLAQLEQPALRQEICNAIDNDGAYENFLRAMGPDAILIISCPNTKEYNGKTVAEISKALGLRGSETVARLYLENSGEVLMAVRTCEEDVVEAIYRHPYTCNGSDGIGAGLGILTHPRAYGATVRIFETFVRERKVVSLEEAVRKCTSLPADFLGLTSKGRIQEGNDADIVIFDRNRIGTDGSFQNPCAPPRGICYVFVDGRMAVRADALVD